MRYSWSFAAALVLVACAGRPPEVPTRAVDSDAHASTESSAEASAASGPRAATEAAAEGTDDRPQGALVCRTVTSGGGATELYLQWNGDAAEGVLRETAPSGMIHQKKVHAERQGGVVIADDIYEKDLVAHAALVADRSGKKVMKVEGEWSRCE